MSEIMRAVLYEGTETPQVREIPIPTPESGEVLLEILRAGICGTDLSILSGKHPRAAAPLILGHEVAARVVEDRYTGSPGEHSLELAPGTLVTVEPIISCGKCFACNTGIPHVCRSLQLYGIDLPGGMAEYMVARKDRLIPADPGMVPETVVLAEPLAVAVHAVRLSGVRYGDSVCIIGGGPIGILTAMVAAETTPGRILVSEPESSRRAVAEHAGIETVDPATNSLAERVAELTDGRGADLVFDCAGSSAAVASATGILRPRGRLVQVAIPKEPRAVNLVDVTFKELEMIGVRVYEPLDFRRALQFLSRKPALFEPLCGEPFSLDQAAEAFDAARRGDQGLRILFSTGEA